mmetsp:Transcript_22562/g.71565  ORF Transcript_22562/g.71565 Transcript_22562/m.71565 type:complete len:287 (+) Transcript_22562:152-1012(+)
MRHQEVPAAIAGEVDAVLAGRASSLFGNSSRARQAAAAMNLSKCPPMKAVSILLERAADRTEMLELNRKRMGKMMGRFPALDGSNHTHFEEFWRWLGFRLNPATFRGWMRSYGAVSATLSHLNALRWQVQERLPFLLRLEDDIYILDAHFLKGLSCFLTRFLIDRRRLDGERTAGLFDVVHFHFGPGPVGVGADAYLTSMEGAANELRRFCARGIYNGFDFMTNTQRHAVLTVGKQTTTSMMRRKNAPTGKGSVVRVMAHMNMSQLRAWTNESASWSLSRCMRWLE